MIIKTAQEFLSYFSKLLTKRSNGTYEINVGDAGDNALVGCVANNKVATTNAILDACVGSNKVATTNAILDACVGSNKVATTNAILDVALGSNTGTATVTTAAKTASFTPAVGADYIITLGQAGHATLTTGDTIAISQDGYDIVSITTAPTGGPAAFSALGRYVAALIGGVAVNVVLTGENGGTDVTVRFDRIVR